MSYGLDTLVSQAFGAGSLLLVGIFFQTALLVITLASIPIMITLYFTETILLFLQQEPVLAQLSGLPSLLLLP